MAESASTSQRGTKVERRVRRGFELFLLAASLIAGLAVVGGCGMVVKMGFESTATLLLTIAASVLLVGIVYLATSMSRDVRIVRQAVLDRERRAAQDPEQQ